MGNTLAAPVFAHATDHARVSGDSRGVSAAGAQVGSVEALAELLLPEDTVYQSPLGGGRLFRTCVALVEEGTNAGDSAGGSRDDTGVWGAGRPAAGTGGRGNLSNRAGERLRRRAGAPEEDEGGEQGGRPRSGSGGGVDASGPASTSGGGVATLAAALGPAPAKRQRRVVVKVHMKRPGAPSFSHHVRMVELLSSALEGASHVLPYTLAYDAEHSASLVRRKVWKSLVQRLGVRPFLTQVEKRWAAYQLLRALSEAHGRGARHGDIKGENVLVTSFGWLYVTDFAWFKPVELPEDNPADFSFYFDTVNGRRKCTVAPERFVHEVAPEAQLTDAMDIFSAGCVLAELVLDGRPLFDLSALLAYKRGEFSPADALTGTDDDALARLALEMIDLDPNQRESAGSYLSRHRGLLFPEYFDDLHERFERVSTLDAEERLIALDGEFDEVCEVVRLATRRCPADAVDGGGGGGGGASGGGGGRAPPDGQPRGEPRGARDGVDGGGGEAPAAGPSAAGTSAIQATMSLMEDVSSFAENLHRGPNTVAAAGEDLAAFVDDDDDTLPADGERGRGAAWCAEGTTEPPEPPKPPAAAAAAEGAGHPAAAAAVSEVVTEVMYEHEMRDAGADVFAPTGFGSLWASRALGGATPVRKEDMRLPLEGGWSWAGDWELALPGAGGSGPDGDGWLYRAPDGTWSRSPSPSAGPSLWRRRQWVRRRVRRSHARAGRRGERRARAAGAGAGRRSAAGALCADGMCLVSVVVCSASRGARRRESKCRAARLLLECAHHCDDNVRLQRIVPYLVALTSDGAAAVKVLALRYLKAVLSLIASFAPGDARMFPDYIFPSLSSLPSHAEELVRVEYAACVAEIARAAHAFIDRAQYLSSRSVAPSAAAAGPAEVAELRTLLQRAVMDIMQGASTAQRRALLPTAGALCEVFGRQESNDVILPLLITCLNDRDWQMRASFLSVVPGVARYVGSASIEAFVVPCIEQAVFDVEVAVVEAALACEAALVRSGLLRRRSVIAAARRAAPLLCHPSPSVAAAALAVVDAASAGMSAPEFYAKMLPILKPLSAGGGGGGGGWLSPAAPGAGLPRPLPRGAYEAALRALQGGEFDELVGAMAADARPRRRELARVLAAMRGFLESVASVAATRASVPRAGADAAGGATPHRRRGSSRASAAAAAAPVHMVRTEEREGGGGRGAAPVLQPNGMLAAATRHQQHPDGRPAVTLLQPRWQRRRRQYQPEEEPADGAASVHDAVAAAVSASMPRRAALDWVPRGVLVAHLEEHRGAVSVVRPAASGSFVVSGSDDGTCKVWDVRRLEKDVAFASRATYAGHAAEGGGGGRVLCAACMPTGDAMVSGCSGGALHVWDVEYTVAVRRGVSVPDKYRGASRRRRHDAEEGAVVAALPLGAHEVLYSTQRGGVRAMDVRGAAGGAWRLPFSPGGGVLRHLVAGGGGLWLATGSSRGVVTLWDVRYRVPMSSWTFPARAGGIAAMCAAMQNQGQDEHGAASSPEEPLLYVSAAGEDGPQELGLLDARDGRCAQVIRVVRAADQGGQGGEDATSPPRVAAAAADAHQPTGAIGAVGAADVGGVGGMRALLPVHSGMVITGGCDRTIRVWNCVHPDESYVVSSPQRGRRRKVVRHSGGPGGATLVQELPGGLPPNSVIGEEDEGTCHHRDVILDMCITPSPQQRLLLSAGRDGVIKVWK